MENRIVLNSKHFEITLKRLASQLKENHQNFENTVLVGLQPRGIYVLERLKSILEADLGKSLQCGQLDITFYRDDFRRRDTPLIPSVTNIDFIIENENFERELYSGFIGPVNLMAETHLFVNLRCAKINKENVLLFAGAGVTENSVAEKEWNETEQKV